MSNINLEATLDTPKVIFSPENNTLHIEGECYPENPLPFFTPILDTLQGHLVNTKPARFEAHMRMQYINSASTMGLRKLFAILDEAGLAGSDINVIWAFEEDDDAIEELGMDLVEDFTYINLERQPFAA
jgi:hypothetical protein